MQWDLVEVDIEISIVSKIAMFWLFIATIVLIYLFFACVRDSLKMRRQLRLWLEKGEQPLQPTFISAEEWAAIVPFQWKNLSVWEHYFNLWIRPQLNLFRKARSWAIFAILIGLVGTIFELICAFQMIVVIGSAHIVSLSERISYALVPFFYAIVVGLFFYLLAFFADAQIAHWRKRMLDSSKNPIETKDPITKQQQI